MILYMFLAIITYKGIENLKGMIGSRYNFSLTKIKLKEDI